MSARPKSFLFQLLAGPPGRQRQRVSAVLMSGCAYVVLGGLMLDQAYLGLSDRVVMVGLTATSLVIWAVFYALIRSGASGRWADPGLALPQMAFGMAVAAVAYAASGPTRGASMTLIVLVMAFGLFILPSAGQARAIAGFGLALLGMAMGWKVHVDPQAHPPAVELVHFFYAVLSVAAVLALVSRMAALRSRLCKQQSELTTALNQIMVLATQDELTALPNRRYMTELMVIEKARQERNGRVMSVAMIDIDFFKRINDTYGHTGGDLVLKTFAQFSTASLRPADALARWGGEEFLLLLPETSVEDAMLCVERMRLHFTRMSADAIAPGLHVTFSAGVSGCKAGDPLEDTIERADQAMHRAKMQGRNRTVLG